METGQKKIAFVVPRYVVSSAGGAEVACRLFAENLAARKGMTTEILTTCAENHFTWVNVHPEGASVKNGVTVRRFPADKRGNTYRFDKLAEKLLSKQSISAEEEAFFFENNLNSRPLYRFIEQNQKDYAFFIFIPYLYGLTVNGAKICPEKTLLIPCLHDEPYARLASVKKTLQSAKGIICNSPPERDLILGIGQVPPDRTRVVGIGVSAAANAAEEKVLTRYGIRPPYIFYCGRRERGKNFDLLLEMFREFRKQNQFPLQFVSAGSGHLPVAPSEKEIIIDAGFVSEEVKARLYRSALLTCQPSTKESFSIVLLESWLQKRPVIVSSRCPVTDHWVKLCKGGFSFKNFFEFEEALDLAVKNKDLLDRMGQNGYEFTVRNFSWDKITERLFNALIHFGYML